MKESRTKIATAVLLILIAIVPAVAEDGNQSHRKVKWQTPPLYPEMAQRMNLSGTVRLEITIRPDGTVKDAKVLGGHPVLADAAQRAVQKWKYEPGPEEKEIVSLDFRR